VSPNSFGRIAAIEGKLLEANRNALKAAESSAVGFAQNRRIVVVFRITFKHDSRPLVHGIGHHAERPSKRVRIAASTVKVREMRAWKIDQRIPSDVRAVPYVISRVKVKAQARNLRQRVALESIYRRQVLGEALLKEPLRPSWIHVRNDLLESKRKTRKPGVLIVHVPNGSSEGRR